MCVFVDFLYVSDVSWLPSAVALFRRDTLQPTCGLEDWSDSRNASCSLEQFLCGSYTVNGPFLGATSPWRPWHQQHHMAPASLWYYTVQWVHSYICTFDLYIFVHIMNTSAIYLICILSLSCLVVVLVTMSHSRCLAFVGGWGVLCRYFLSNLFVALIKLG